MIRRTLKTVPRPIGSAIAVRAAAAMLDWPFLALASLGPPSL